MPAITAISPLVIGPRLIGKMFQHSPCCFAVRLLYNMHHIPDRRTRYTSTRILLVISFGLVSYVFFISVAVGLPFTYRFLLLQIFPASQ